MHFSGWKSNRGLWQIPKALRMTSEVNKNLLWFLTKNYISSFLTEEVGGLRTRLFKVGYLGPKNFNFGRSLGNLIQKHLQIINIHINIINAFREKRTATDTVAYYTATLHLNTCSALLCVKPSHVRFQTFMGNSGFHNGHFDIRYSTPS